MVESVAPNAAKGGVNELSAARLRVSPKYADYGVVRVIPPKETVRRVAPLADAIGVTRVAEVTGLDRVGIPNFTTVRPREPGFGISYYNGKGVTKEAAKAGALMEAIERHTGEMCDLPILFGSYAQIRERGAAVDPTQIIEPHVVRCHPDLPLEWVRGYDLLGDRPTYVPLNAVVCPYVPVHAGAAAPYFSHTNGLASGNTVEEALCHAMCEVLERDAVALSDTAHLLAGAVRRFGAAAGVAPGGDGADGRGRPRRLVDLGTLPPRALKLVRRMQEADLLVYLREVTSQLGIATFDCVCVERKLDGHHLAHGGYGAHPDARVAVTRALTEAAQSRVAHIQGGREDLPQILRTGAPYEPDTAYGEGEKVPFSATPSYELPNVDDDIHLMLERLREASFTQMVAVDLTRPELDVPVIRVVIPGVETWSAFFTHGSRRARLGPRANRVLCETLRGGAPA